MTMDPDSNPIPTAIKELLALFDGPLADVRFPDVDGAALREQVASVDAAVRDVEAAAAAWAEAKRTVDARLEVLLNKAQRALSYARVYAEDKPELDTQLAALMLPKWGDPRGTSKSNGAGAGAEPVAARKRGRPKKSEAAAPPPKAPEPITLLPASTPEPAATAEVEPASTPDVEIEVEAAPVSETDIAAE